MPHAGQVTEQFVDARVTNCAKVVAEVGDQNDATFDGKNWCENRRQILREKLYTNFVHGLSSTSAAKLCRSEFKLISHCHFLNVQISKMITQTCNQVASLRFHGSNWGELRG